MRLVRLDRVPGERTVLRGSHFLPWLRSRLSVSDAFVAALDRRPSPEAAGKFDTLFRGEITSRRWIGLVRNRWYRVIVVAGVGRAVV